MRVCPCLLVPCVVACIAACLALLPGPIEGQAPDLSEPSSAEEVTGQESFGKESKVESAEPPTFYETATVRERPLATATASVTVIGRSEIVAAGVRTVAELLPFVPGVGVITAGTRGGLTTAQIRGGDPNFTLVLIDGVPVNDPTYQVGGVFDFEALPTAAVERIEVVRGPLSAVYGSTGLAGAIHVVTRSGRGDGEARGEAEIAGDEFGIAVTAAAGGGGERVRWFLAAGAEEEDERIAREEFEELHLQGRLDVSLPGGADLRIAGRVAGWDASDYPDASGGPVLGDGALRSSDHLEASLGAELRAGRQRLDVSVYRHRLERRSPAVGLQVPAADEDLRFTRSRLGWSWADGWESGPSRWSWAAGLSVEHEDARNESVLRLSPIFGGFEVPGDYEEERTSAGVFGELTLDRGDFVAELGLRVDEPDGSSTQTSPRLGLSYRAGGGATRLRASVGRAFKLPSFFALASPPALGGNSELRPEIMEGADLGLDRSFAGDRASVGLSVFHTRYEDLVDFDFATFSHVNRSRVRARGVELSLDWRPNDGVRVFAQITRQDVEDLDTGDLLRQRPDLRGALRIDWRASPRLDLHLEGRHVGDFRDEQIPVVDRFVVAEHEIWSLAATYRFDEAWLLSVRAENLTDEDYETLIGFPGPERSVRVGLRYRFGVR